MSDKPLAGYKRLWAFVFYILLLFVNIMDFFFVIIPKLTAGTIVANDYGQWVLVNFILLIILSILYFGKSLLIFAAKVEDKIAE
jgi:hypothetical protein